MDLFDVARACARRWYVTLPSLLLAVLFSTVSYMNVETQYFGTTVLGIAPPVAPDTREGLPANGLMDSGGIGLVSNLVALGLQDELVRVGIADQGGLPTYLTAVYTVPGGQLPLVTIDVTGSTPSDVEKTLELVTQQAGTTLQQIQDNAGVVAVSQAKTYRVRPPTAPEARKPGRARTTVAIFVVGIGLSVLIGVASDVVINRVRGRKRSAAGPHSDSTAPVESADSPATSLLGTDGPGPTYTAPDSGVTPDYISGTHAKVDLARAEIHSR